MNKFESFIALRYLKSKRKEVFISIITVISVLGVTISVMVLDIVLGVMTGFERELQSKLINSTAHVTIRQIGSDLAGWQEITEKVRTVKGVTDVAPYTYSQAMLSANNLAHGLLIRGISNEIGAKEKLTPTLENPATVEKLFSDAAYEIVRPDGENDSIELPSIIIGRTLARRFNLQEGSVITLLSPQFSASPQGLIPRMRRFIVVAIYHSGLTEYESGLAYTSIETAQSFFGLGDRVSGLEITTTDVNQAPQIAKKIELVLGDTTKPLEISDWTVPNKPLWDALKLERRVYFIVLLLLILIASFSIISTLVMVVMEKSRDIAMLKSMGASNSSVMRIFLLQGCFIGSIGTILGTVCGYLGAVALKTYGFPLDETVFSLSTLPVEINFTNYLLVAFSAFIISLMAGVYPARRAAILKPADVFRFE